MDNWFVNALLYTELGFFVLAFVACGIPFLIGVISKKRGSQIGNLIMILSLMMFIVMEFLIIS